MIAGHGDDIHEYEGITMNFSSNIYAHADLQLLLEHLRKRIGLIANYPEPEPRSLEVKLAARLGKAELASFVKLHFANFSRI